MSEHQYPVHEAANLFPLMEGEEFEQLKADIKAHGQREPIWTCQGKIIDGRNRYRACRSLGITPNVREWKGPSFAGGSLVEFVVSLNLHRRHLTSSQRAAVAVEMLPLLEEEARARQRAAGGDRRSEQARVKVTTPPPAAPVPVTVTVQTPPQPVSQKVDQPNADPNAGKAAAQAARLTGTNRQYVAEAKKLKAEDPAAFEEVKAGKRKLRAKGKGKGKVPPAAQEAIVALYEEALPLIEELRHWGRTHRGLMAPGEILKIAVKLERLFEARLPKAEA